MRAAKKKRNETNRLRSKRRRRQKISARRRESEMENGEVRGRGGMETARRGWCGGGRGDGEHVFGFYLVWCFGTDQRVPSVGRQTFETKNKEKKTLSFGKRNCVFFLTFELQLSLLSSCRRLHERTAARVYLSRYACALLLGNIALPSSTVATPTHPPPNVLSAAMRRFPLHHHLRHTRKTTFPACPNSPHTKTLGEESDRPDGGGGNFFSRRRISSCHPSRARKTHLRIS